MYISITIDGEKCKINSDHIAILNPDSNAIVTSYGLGIVLSEEDYNEVEASIFPTRKKVAKEDTHTVELLTKLHLLTGGKGSVILSPKRKKQIQTILAIPEFTEEKLILAATNIGKDKWLQGENDNQKRYGDIDYLLRPDKAVKWAEYKEEDKRRKLF